MTSAHFAGIENAILVNLQKAMRQIKVAVAWFTNPLLFQALLDRQRAGVSVEVILTNDPMNFTNPGVNFQHLIDASGVVRIVRLPKLMHHKFCVIDDRYLISGSYNWTKSAEINNLENVIISADLTLVNQFLQGFEALLPVTEQVSQITAIPLQNFSGESERKREFDLVLSTKKIEDASVSNDSQPTESVIDPELSDLFTLADQYYRQGKYEPALKALTSIQEKNPNLAEVYDLFAAIKWRQGKPKEQIEYGKKAIALDNHFFEAYNMVAIGYANTSNAQKSIEYYKTCIHNDPENYVFLKNRAVSYFDLENDPNIPSSIKTQFKFKSKAVADLENAIALTDKYETIHNDYMVFYVRGAAKALLGKLNLAKTDLLKALDKYQHTPKPQQDIHILREIKQTLKDIERSV